jgi:hypothetical protein
MVHTSIDWFWKQLPEILPSSVDTETGIKLLRAYEEAKEKHKEEIIEAFKHGELPPLFVNLNAEEYYNETFKH